MTAGADTFTYAYLANSDLLAAIAYPHDIASTRTYDNIKLCPPATEADYVGQDGNITAYVDSSDNVIYSCLYSPFGEAFSESGTAPCAFGFSTIYRDSETGFLTYRFRPYDPARGVWIGRDPIEENGGVNLYAMVGNDAVDRWDELGLSSQSWGVVDWKKRIKQIMKASSHGGQLPDMNEVFQKLMKAQLLADPNNDWYGDCQDDMEDIFSALYDEISKAHHGDNVQELFKGMDDGSNITHFFVGAAYEMSTGIANRGEVAQWSFEAWGGFAGDWQRDTAAAYLGSYLANKFDTSDCNCKKMVEAFSRGDIKLSDIFMFNPRKVMPDNISTDLRNTYVKYAQEHMDKLFDAILNPKPKPKVP